ncbi:MAG: MATE family efflux transporter [Oscillospiraceae bacterium]|jgi:putative MATE family efflux protein|nr:MATE family efflux transporter [Oscillospiraceae bacterium]
MNTMKHESVCKMLLTLSLPMAAQGLISFAINMTDVLMVQLLGENELDACIIANIPFIIFFFIISGVGSGACMVCAQYFGKQDLVSIKKIMAVSLNLILVIGGLFSVTLFSVPTVVMRLLTNDQWLVVIGAQYLRFMAPTYLLTGFLVVYVLVLRSMSEVKFALFVELVTLFINIMLNYILIFGKCGFPALGVKGSAYATLTARSVAFLLCIYFLEKKEVKLGFRLRDLFIEKKGVMRNLFKCSYAVVINEVLWGLGLSLNNIVFSKTGSREVIAAVAEVGIFGQLSSVFIVGFASSVEVIIGQLVGSGEFKKLSKFIKNILFVSLAVGVFSLGITLLVKNPVLNMGKLSEIAKMLAAQLIEVNAIILFFQAISSTCVYGILRGGADTKTVLLLDTISLWFFAVPLTWFGLKIFKWPLAVVYLCTRADILVKLIFGFVRIKRGGWIKDVTGVGAKKGVFKDVGA